MDNFSLIRAEGELKLMRQSGQVAAQALKKVISNVAVGKSLVELDQIAEQEILKLGGQPSFKTVPGYRWTTCLAVNDEVVHGIPREIKLKEGDILGIDLGAIYQGWYTDTAWTVTVGSKKRDEFLETGERVLWEAVSQAVEGKRVGDISAAIQTGIEEAGFSVVKSLAGHGVGRAVHEEPEIPEYGQPGKGVILKAGMTLAIEVIYTKERGEIFEKEDGWTLASVDGSLAGLFEMTVIVGKKRAEVITDWRKV